MEQQKFEIVIDFLPGEGDPRRVFSTMSGLIDSLESLDQHLIETFDVAIEAQLVLDEVEAGSLKAKFREVVKGIPDDALKDVSLKKVVGHFLIRAKYTVIRWLEEKSEIGSREDVRALESELQRIAEETNVNRIPAYSAPRPEALLSDVRSVQESLAHLNEGDTATFAYDSNEVKFNRELRVSTEIVRDVLTKEVLLSTGERIMKVKKPDYLGQSMWEFHFEGHAVEAKILHDAWLRQFQNRQVDVKPGDSVRVLLKEEISYGYDGEVVHRHYEIERVHEVIKPQFGTQRKIDF